ncbi:MAG: FAD-dependent oxidoreductase [Actinobacteria bacterium]|nr:FAD-dependent oxidoreductase [Actinomycetota bacterium]
MSEDAVVIVGGGAVGLASAGFLARGGASVVVLERHPELGLDAASGSAGLITPSHALPLAGPRVLRNVPRFLAGRGMIAIKLRPDPGLARFGALAARAGRGELMLTGLRALRDQARAGRELFAELAPDHDFEFRRAGMLNVCATPAGLEEIVEEAELLRREGFEPRVLDGAEAAALEPALREDLAGAVLWTEDASAAPDRALAAFADAARAAGARIETGVEPEGFRRDQDGNVVEVVLRDRSIRARALVLAAGADTPALAARLGTFLPIQPAKGHHLQLASRPSAPRVPMILGEHAMAVSRMGEGMRITGGMDFCGPDRALDPRRIADIVRLSADFLREPPTAADAAGATQWSGVRPCTPDGLPIFGWLRRAPNALVAAGHGMLGFTLSPAVGRDVADLVLGGGRSALEAPWREQFHPARYGA